LAARTPERRGWIDPLTSLKHRHPVIDLALEYRAICLDAPPFASRVSYAALKAEGQTCGVSSVVVHLPEHREAPHA
jgi:hypothetical protein